MKNIYCTLFNINYVDKGVVLYKSLEQVCDCFKLYVLAMDDKTYDVLCDLKYTYLYPIRLSDFENDKLRSAKQNRSFGEYCWTCSSSLIKYILEILNEPICTYVDADMYFYQDPQLLIDEMLYAGASAQVVEHRFAKNDNRAWRVGTYCVEFNTFKNDEAGMQILDEWIEKCLDKCVQMADGIHWGDQKYLDPLVEKYKDKVNILQNLGGGVAPWNIEQYRGVATVGNNVILQEKCTGKMFELNFYHFEGITYINREKATAPLYLDSSNNKIVTGLYADYLIKIEQAKKMLQALYNVDFIIKAHPVMKNFKGGFVYNIKKIWEYIISPHKIYLKFMSKRCFVKF